MERNDDFAVLNGVTDEALCTRLFERHQATIKVKKPHVAVPNLVRVLSTALKLSNRKGFHSMTTRDLSEASGLSMGALYNYMADKDALLDLILDAVTDAVDRVLAPVVADGDPRAALHDLIRRHVLLSEAMLPWFVFNYLEARAFNRAARDLALASELRTEAMLLGPIEAGIRAGLFHAADPAMTATLIKPLLQDWYVKRAKHFRRGITPEAYAGAVIDFVDRALGGRPAQA